MTIILPFRRIVLESPWKATEAHSAEQHRVYLDHCLADCRGRWEAPYASHFGLMGDDDDELQRQLGIRAGWQWGELAEYVVAYGDLGISEGMAQSIAHYEKMGKPVEWRKLDAKLVRSILQM